MSPVTSVGGPSLPSGPTDFCNAQVRAYAAVGRHPLFAPIKRHYQDRFVRVLHKRRVRCRMYNDRAFWQLSLANEKRESLRTEKMKCSGSSALVSGANRGIGQALVHALLGAGVRRIYACARDPKSLAATLAFDRSKVVPLKLDVTDPASIECAVRSAKDVTLLVNNAGVLDFGGILDTPVEKIQRNFDTNFYGALGMARAFSPVIEHNGGGAIVNILTLVALASMPGLAVYNASKAAAWSMTQSLRASLAGRKIEVYGVFPGAVDTDMLKGVEMAKTSPADVARAIVAGVDDGREDIFPDPMSLQIYGAWRQDHKAVERQFATM